MKQRLWRRIAVALVIVLALAGTALASITNVMDFTIAILVNGVCPSLNTDNA